MSADCEFGLFSWSPCSGLTSRRHPHGPAFCAAHWAARDAEFRLVQDAARAPWIAPDRTSGEEPQPIPGPYSWLAALEAQGHRPLDTGITPPSALVEACFASLVAQMEGVGK